MRDAGSVPSISVVGVAGLVPSSCFLMYSSMSDNSPGPICFPVCGTVIFAFLGIGASSGIFACSQSGIGAF